MSRKILLIEPNYLNKYPPIGLIKIATYHKRMGDEVVFFKGDLKNFVIERIANKCIESLYEAEKNLETKIDWRLKKDKIFNFIKTGKKSYCDEIELSRSPLELNLYLRVTHYKEYFKKKIYETEPEWDRVFVTTLFTFYWDITIKTINFAKKLVKKDGLLQVGGVMASLQPKEIENETGIKPHIGLLNRAGDLDPGNSDIMDNLPLDYSILDEILYNYPMSNSFYGYTTRSCIRTCPFCAVPKLEPNYIPYIPLQERISEVRELYGDKKDLLLMDNNILASEQLPQIIEDIIRSGFGKGAKYKKVDQLSFSIKKLLEGNNDRAYLTKTYKLFHQFYNSLEGDESYEIYKLLKENYVWDILTTTKENLLKVWEIIKPVHQKKFKPTSTGRYIDFNQGVDARLFTEENVKLLSTINIKPLRIAFDHLSTREPYENAIRMSARNGIKDFSNYLLYNYNDHPIDLYTRLQININLCKEFNNKIQIYSFPMKYHPIFGNHSHNREYIGKHWNKKYIRTIQVILNSTKGKIDRSETFFYKAFGYDEDEFYELLEMPETLILYRYFFEWLDDLNHPLSTNNWRTTWNRYFENATENEAQETKKILHNYDFKDHDIVFSSKSQKELCEFYFNFEKDISIEGTELYKLKKEYDKNPTKELRKNKGIRKIL